MTSSVIVRPLISGISGALVAMITSFSIEKYGGLVGGFIGSLPTTTLASCLGIWFQLNEGVDETLLKDPETYNSLRNQATLKFQRAMFMIPIGLLINSTFVLLWKYIPKKIHARFPTWTVSQVTWSSLACTLLYWLLLAISATLLHLNLVPKDRTDIPMILGITCLCGIVLNSYISNWKVPLTPKGKKPVSFQFIILRGLIAGVVVGFSVYLSVLSEIIGGIASIFPAIYTTVIVSVSLSQGEDVRDGVLGSLMMGGITIALFSLINAWIIPILGLTWSIILSLLISSICGAVPGLLYLRWRRNVCLRGSLDAITVLHPQILVLQNDKDVIMGSNESTAVNKQ